MAEEVRRDRGKASQVGLERPPFRNTEGLPDSGKAVAQKRRRILSAFEEAVSREGFTAGELTLSSTKLDRRPRLKKGVSCRGCRVTPP